MSNHGSIPAANLRWTSASGAFQITTRLRGPHPIGILILVALVSATLFAPLVPRITATDALLLIEIRSPAGIPLKWANVPLAEAHDVLVRRPFRGTWARSAVVVDRRGSEIATALPIYFDNTDKIPGSLHSLSASLQAGKPPRDSTVIIGPVVALVGATLLWGWAMFSAVIYRFNLNAGQGRITHDYRPRLIRHRWSAAIASVACLREESRAKFKRNASRLQARWVLVMRDGSVRLLSEWGDGCIEGQWRAFCALADHLNIPITVGGQHGAAFDFTSVRPSSLGSAEIAIRSALVDAAGGVRMPGVRLYTTSDAMTLRGSPLPSHPLIDAIFGPNSAAPAAQSGKHGAGSRPHG